MSTDTHTRRPTSLEALKRALDQGTMRQVHRLVNSIHPAEIASLLESLPPTQREVVWDLVDPELEGDVLVELNDEVRAGLIREMEPEELVAAAEGLEVDDLADDVAQRGHELVRQSIVGNDQYADHGSLLRARATSRWVTRTSILRSWRCRSRAQATATERCCPPVQPMATVR